MKKERSSKETIIASSQSFEERFYWINKFSEEFEKCCFHYDYPVTERNKAPMDMDHMDRLQVKFPHPLFARAVKLSGESDTKLFMILVTGLAILLYKYTGSKDITVGAPIYKQDIEGEFINTVIPLRNQVHPHMTFKELLQGVRKNIIDGYKNQNYPMNALLQELGIPLPDKGFPLFDIAILLENIHDKRYILHTNPSMFFSFIRTDTNIELVLEYGSSIYEKQTVERIGIHFMNLLHQALADVDLHLSQILLMSGEEMQQVLVAFNCAEAERAANIATKVRNKTISQLFEEQVRKTPDNPAVVVCGGIEKKEITYRQLNKKVLQLAHVLRQKGIKPDTIVGIMLNPSIEMVVGILGVLKAGGAYLPIDSDFPPHRIHVILQDSAVRYLISKRQWMDKVDFSKIVIDLEDETLFDAASLPLEAEETPINTSTNLAYIIYTSGSTGAPKGVLIEHRNLLNYVYWRLEAYRQTSQDVCLQLLSIAFDGFCANMYPTLLSGGKLVLINENRLLDIPYIGKVIAEEQVTMFSLTPLWYKSILEGVKEEDLRSVRFVVIGGDHAGSDTLKMSQRKAPQIRLINEYGPTENSVTTAANIGMTVENASVVGQPIANNYVYFLDENQSPRPIGAPGELCICGDGLARGYLNYPQLTAEKFKVNPLICPDLLISQTIPPGSSWPFIHRLYYTGDRGRWLAGGLIELVGRMDDQIKIRGYRVELGEIETFLLSHHYIKEAIVMVARGEVPGESATDTPDKTLYAFYVLNDPKAILSAEEIKKYLSRNLPDYMIPSYFFQLEAIPYTPSAKIDRRKLLALAESIKGKTEFVEPRNEIERKLVDIWKEMLQIERVGIKDNFFNIGGDSIKILSLVNHINKKFGTRVKIEALYENDTVEQMAVLLDKNRRESLSEEYKKAEAEIEELKARIMKRIDQTANIEDIYPMSDVEKGMIYHSLKDDNSNVFQNQFVFYKRDREFILDLFKQAMVLMIQKHPILRVVFNMDDFEEPVQIVLKEINLEIDFHDISSLERNEQEKYLIPILQKDRQKSFDFSGKAPLWRLKLFKLDKENICLVWYAHHAILDGWSSASLMTEINNTYIRLKTEPWFVPQPLKSTYKEFVIEQLYQKKQEESKAFWRKELEGYNRVKIWGPHHLIAAAGKKKMYHLDMEISLLEKLKETANTYNITLRNMCFAAHVYTLNLISFENDITAGFVINNRPACEDGDKIIGCFLNTLPVRIKIPADLTWKDYMKLVDKKLLQLAKYSRLSLFEISVSLGERVQKENPIVDTIFIFTDYFILKQLDQQGTDEDILAETWNKLDIEGEGYSNTLLDFSIDTTFGKFCLTFSYPDSMSDDMIRWLAVSYEKVLKKFTIEPDSVVDGNEFILAEHKQKLLYDFNNNPFPYSQDKTLHRLFAEQVSRKADRTAMVLSNGHLTYDGLNEHSNRIAGALREKGIRVNCIVGLIMRNSLAMAVGILGVLKSGGAYLPIDPYYPNGRKTYVIDDSKIKTLVVDYLPADKEIEISGLSSVSIIGVNNENLLAPGKSVESPETPCGPGDTAYVIYTSGTTGRPRGVLIPHKGAVNYTSWRIKMYGYTERDVTLQLLPYYFDGFGSNFYSSLLSGGILMMVPDSRKRDYDYVNEVIRQSCVTNMSLVPGMYEALLNVAIVQGYSFKSLRFVVLAGERSSKILLEKSIQHHPFLVHINEYGPTEISVTAAANIAMTGENTHIIGKPIANTHIYILNTHFKMVPLGIPGELCIEGVGLAKGYLNHPELSAEKFVKSPYNEGKRLYRSGDMARWRENGDLEYLGRLDQQVKIRGFRIEIEEIEYQLLRYNHVKEVVVIAREADTTKEHAMEEENIFLCAYVVSHKKIDIAPLKEFLFQQLPEYMIPTYIVQVDAIPLTPSGKVDRKILPDPDIETKFNVPHNETEEKVAEIWAEVLKIKKSDISIDHNFFQLGGHSLRATVLAVKMQKEFNVELTVEDMFTLSTIRQLSEYIKKEAGKKKFSSIEAVEKKEYYPLSSAQKRLFFIQRMLPESIAYNLTQIFILSGRFGREKWERTFTKLIERHESLRTSHEIINGEPVQRIKEMDELEFKIEYFEIDKEEEKVIKNFIQPFDLSRASLLRVGLINAGKTNHIMIVDMHHIISDGVSHGTLMRDFFILYNGEQLPPLRLQYKDYAEWQVGDKQNEALMGQEEYWSKRLERGIPVLKMFTDYARPARENFEADYLSFEVGKELSRKLNEIVKETGTTLFILLLAVYNILLSKYTGQEDIIVGSTIAGRNHADLEHIIGIFVNLLAMRNQPAENKRFIDFLKEVKTNTIDAFENQDYPFDELVKKLGLERNWRRNPLFDTQFILQNLEREREGIEVEGLTFEPYNYKKTQTPFDLFLEAIEINDTVTLRLIYLTSLYKRSTIEYMSKHYIEILQQVVVNRDIPLKDIRISHALSAAQSVVSQKEVMEFEL